MGNMTAGLTADRIRVASALTPIIVERLGRSDTFRSFFADTVFGARYLKNPAPEFLGVYHGTDGAHEFLEASLLRYDDT